MRFHAPRDLRAVVMTARFAVEIRTLLSDRAIPNSMALLFSPRIALPCATSLLSEDVAKWGESMEAYRFPSVDLSGLRRKRPRITMRYYDTAHRPADEVRQELSIGLAWP